MRIRNHALRIGAIVAAVLSCSPPGTFGLRNEGIFSYQCDPSQDAACPAEMEGIPLPPVIAVGGRFALSFRSKSRGIRLPIEPASPDMAPRMPGDEHFIASLPGQSAFLVLTNTGKVVDFVHARFANVASLRLMYGSDPTPGPLGLSVSPDLAVEPIDNRDVVLGGSFDYAWVSFDPFIVSVQPNGRFATLTAKGTGTTTIRVTAAGQTVEIPVTVGAAP